MLIFVSCSMGEENSDFEKSYFNVIPKMANLDLRNIFYQSDRYIDIMDVSDDGKVLLTYTIKMTHVLSHIMWKRLSLN